MGTLTNALTAPNPFGFSAGNVPVEKTREKAALAIDFEELLASAEAINRQFMETPAKEFRGATSPEVIADSIYNTRTDTMMNHYRVTLYSGKTAEFIRLNESSYERHLMFLDINEETRNRLESLPSYKDISKYIRDIQAELKEEEIEEEVEEEIEEEVEEEIEEEEKPSRPATEQDLKDLLSKFKK